MIVVAKNLSVLQLFISRMPKMCAILQLVSAPFILGDPGAVRGGGKKLGRRKVKNEEKSPWGQSFNGPGACFSKVPKLFGRISGDTILFVSSKRRRLEARKLFLFLFPLQHMKRQALQNKQVIVLRLAFRARKVVGTFEKRAPGPLKLCPQGLFSSFLTFLRPNFFPAPSNCPWVSEDGLH